MRATPRYRTAIAASAAALTAASVIGGCSSSSSGNSAASNKGPLNVWIRGAGDAQKAYDKLFSDFTAKTGIQVKTFSTLTDFETKVNAAAAGHRLPDIVIDDAAQLGAFRSEGILQPVDKTALPGASDITDIAWKSALGSDGTYYAVPFSAQANLLFERSDWQSQHNLQQPMTWDDLLNTAKAFTSGNTYGIAVPGATTRGYISWYWSTFLWQAGGDYFKSDGNGKYTSTIDSPEAVQAATWFENLFCSSKVVQPGATNAVTTDTNKAFQTGVAGLYLTGPYAFATSDATKIKGKYNVYAPPAGPQNADTLAEGTDIYLMAGSGHTGAAKQLAAYMITPDAQKIGMTAVPTSTIVRLSVNKNVDAATVHAGDPRWKLAEQEYLDHGHYEPDYMPNWPAFRTAASDALNKMVSSCSSPSDALKSLNDKYNSLLQQQGVAG